MYRLQDCCCIELVIKGIGGDNSDKTDTGKNALIGGCVYYMLCIIINSYRI